MEEVDDKWKAFGTRSKLASKVKGRQAGVEREKKRGWSDEEEDTGMNWKK